MLKKLRVTLAAIFFICITLLFLDFTGTLHAWLGWMAKIQFIPAVLALNLAVIVLLVLLTLVLGRVYCSVICPLGIFQDIRKAREETEEQVFIFPCEIMAAVHVPGHFHRGSGGRHRVSGSAS